MIKKIERNEKCPCGSGKKFKKCCLSKNNILVQIENKFKSINFLDHINYNPKKKSQLLYVVSTTNLPDEITQIIHNYTRDEKLIQGGCWYNSSHLSLIEERIKIVHGYHGTKMSNGEEQSIKKLIKLNGISPNLDDWYPFEDEYGKGFFDLKNKTILSPHSWNQFEDTHFDLTKEYDSSLKNDWVYYYPIKTESTSSINLQTKNQLIRMVIDAKNYNNKVQIN
jgi:hypothetical protein